MRWRDPVRSTARVDGAGRYVKNTGILVPAAWEWASNDRGSEPDMVMACAGGVPALEVLAAVALLRQHIPELKVRVVNVVDRMTLQPKTEHPHGLADNEFDSLLQRTSR